VNLSRVIVALDTSSVKDAAALVHRLSDHITTYKIGPALVINHGLDVIGRLRDAGAERVFLDLKLHDIPNTVALAVFEAARYGVWMMTLHVSGGSTMLRAAVEAAEDVGPLDRPFLVGVTVLTSLSEDVLHEELGVGRDVIEQVDALTRLAQDSGLDGVVCSPREAAHVRSIAGADFLLVCPGVRQPGGDTHDHRRTATAAEAFEAGASYVVIGRALTASHDPLAALQRMLEDPSAPLAREPAGPGGPSLV
jgi:orotidine-5'-phosphate decarboxylase